MELRSPIEPSSRRSTLGVPAALAVGGSLLAIVLAACAGDRCDTDSDCERGARCVMNDCTKGCVVSQDCIEPGAVCRNGTCQEGGGQCATAADCTEPGACQVATGATCVAGICVYQADTMGAPCVIEGGGLDGRCLQGECVECLEAAHCPPAPAVHPLCFAPSCVSNTCAYAVLRHVICVAEGCVDGTFRSRRTCGTDGSCPPLGVDTSCDGYACSADGSACLTTCTNDGDCIAGFFCDLGTATCRGLLPDGSSCVVGGDNACLSGHCTGGVCCAGGDCCLDPSDCPAAYQRPSACDEPSRTSDCQGTRGEAVCTDYVCGIVSVADDSGCDPYVRSCAPLAAVGCTGDADQPTPICPTSCATAGCETGYSCQGGACTLLLGTGQTCSGTCGTGLHCQNGVCCLAGATCCTAPAQCADGRACNATTSTCFASCIPNTSGECADPSTYCADGSRCLPKGADGQSCVTGGQCQSGFCVDGVCCNAACAGPCQSCRASATGGADGACAAVQADIDPGACDLQGNGCAAAGCTCKQGQCRIANGQSCASDGACAAGHCECADAACARRVCSAADCAACAANPNGDMVCEIALDAGVTCAGCGAAACACAAGGACEKARGQSCTLDGECASGFCECANVTCSAKICSDVDCPLCQYTTTGTPGTCAAVTSKIVCGPGLRCYDGQCVSPGMCSCFCYEEPIPCGDPRLPCESQCWREIDPEPACATGFLPLCTCDQPPCGGGTCLCR